MASPLSKDLLSKAIGESGGAFYSSGLGFEPREVREQRDSQFAQTAFGTTKLADLRKLSADEILKAATAKPTPPPTPQPTPRITPAPHYTLAPQTVVRAPAPRAAATPHAAVGGAAAHRRIVHRTVVSHPAPPQSIAEGTHAGLQNGGTGTGAGPGSGTSGLGGTGSGTSGAGTGNGGETNTSPCGAVYLEPGEVSYRHDGTVVQHVVAKIVLGDGTVEIGRFPYPFLYPAERMNPFVHEDALRPDKGIPVQLPPPGTDMSGAPMAVQIALKYTNPDTGTTTLRDCGSASQAP